MNMETQAGALAKLPQPMHACVLSRFSSVPLFVTLWTVAHQAPLSLEFSRQEYHSELPFPSPGDLSNPGIKPTPLLSPALADRFFTTSATWGTLEKPPSTSKSHPHFSQKPSYHLGLFSPRFLTLILCLIGASLLGIPHTPNSPWKLSP